jgi:hypothetical protein
MSWLSFAFDLTARREREGGAPFDAQYFYCLFEDMSCGTFNLLVAGSGLGQVSFDSLMASTDLSLSSRDEKQK